MNKYLIVLCVCMSGVLSGQEKEYIGAGNSDGITVMTSSDFFETSGENTINGSGLDVEEMEVSRFLAQASLGFSQEHIDDVMSQGIENWIDIQMAMKPTYLSEELDEIFQIAKANYDNNKSPDDEDYYGPSAIHFNYAWWQTNLSNDDLLRHRVAMALSEILVISFNSDLEGYGLGVADYYDVLINHAFGNYKDLLLDVTLHPCMGYYLSHLSNPKTDEQNNVHPDENYAREIMQLFTIGLYELNPDGSRKLSNGQLTPTYDNNDIRELAKVFTGLAGSAWSQEALDYLEMNGIPATTPVSFGEGIYSYSRTEPMKMYEDQHEMGAKTIIGNKVIATGQTGMKDIKDAIDILFNHSNTAPFISKLLIQRLVKSNPSPRYINRVSNVFQNNGQGERGDLGAVIKAILMDQEARSCEWQQNPSQGMLREPIVRYLHYSRALGFDSPTGFNWNNGVSFLRSTKQHPLAAPSVFNFYLPDYQPVGEFTNQNLVAPEFQIHDSQTAVGYINEVHQWTAWEILFWSWEEYNELGFTYADHTYLEQIAADNEELINHLDIMLTHGRLSDKTRNVIRRSLDQLDEPWLQEARAKMALYLIMISPDYTILK